MPAPAKTDSAADGAPEPLAPYLVIPHDERATRPRLQISLEQLVQPQVPRSTSQPQEVRPQSNQPPNVPDPVYTAQPAIRLSPAWHTEVPAYFQPAAGTHVFAFIHPFTHRTA